MSQLQTLLVERINAAITAAQAAGELPAFDLPVFTVERPKRAEQGDYALAVMSLAKPARLAPLKIAELIAARLPADGPFSAPVVAPPGYLNFALDATWVQAQVPAILAAGETWGNRDDGHGRRAQVEFVSANPTGPLHIGRVRGAVLGDTLANVLGALGWVVTRENYFNDTGKQVESLGESLRLRYWQALGRAVEFPESDTLYKGEYLITLAQKLVAEYGDTLAEAERVVFERHAKDAMFANIKATLQRLNVRMDVFFSEESLHESGAVEAVLQALKDGGHTYEQEGALWFRITALGGTEDRVIVRTNGTPTYRLPDMAYHKNKLVDRGFDLVVDVLGADHKEEWKEVMYGLRAAGLPAERVQLLMHQFITFKGERMSTRKGNIVTVDDLLDEVGTDAARYFILQRSPDSHLEFDLDLAIKESKENPVYYVQYAHTRTTSILRKAREEHGLSADELGDVRLLAHPKELAFIRRALDLEDVLLHVATRLEPHHLAFYAYDLARALNAFYDEAECRVLPGGDPPVAPALTQARLTFVRAAQSVLGKTLRVMGMGTPETM